jgi:hypothetical protein
MNVDTVSFSDLQAEIEALQKELKHAHKKLQAYHKQLILFKNCAANLSHRLKIAQQFLTYDHLDTEAITEYLNLKNIDDP